MIGRYLLYTRNSVVFEMVKFFLKRDGLLQRPLSVSSFVNLSIHADFGDSSTLFRQADAVFEKIFMRNMVLKFDNPLKTGL